MKNRIMSFIFMFIFVVFVPAYASADMLERINGQWACDADLTIEVQNEDFGDKTADLRSFLQQRNIIMDAEKKEYIVLVAGNRQKNSFTVTAETANSVTITFGTHTVGFTLSTTPKGEEILVAAPPQNGRVAIFRRVR